MPLLTAGRNSVEVLTTKLPVELTVKVCEFSPKTTGRISALVISIPAARTGAEDNMKERINKDFNAVIIGLETPPIFSMMFLEILKTLFKYLQAKLNLK